MPAKAKSNLNALLKKPQPLPNRKSAKKSAKKNLDNDLKVPADGDWRSTDEDEINRRRLRAREEAMSVTNLLQAQRDFFGAHTYERIDKPEGQFFHTEWPAVIG